MNTRAPPVVLLDDVVRMARQEVDKAGSQAEFARKAGVRGSNLNSTVTGKAAHHGVTELIRASTDAVAGTLGTACQAV
jgi:hypothetical protein